MSFSISTFLSNIGSCSGDPKDIEKNLKLMNDEIQKRKLKLTKRNIRDIITIFYDETSKYPELNDFWGKYVNVIRYNNKEVRRLIVRDLIERDVKNKVPCPYSLLDIIFKDKELIKLINLPETYLQSALQVKNLTTDFLNYLGGDSKDGKIFRLNLGNLIADNWNCLMFPKDEEKITKSIEELLKYLGLNRCKLNQIDDADILLNFEHFRKVWCNLNMDAYLDNNQEEMFYHGKIVSRSGFFDCKKLLVDYEKGKIKIELFLDHLFDTMVHDNKKDEVLHHLKTNHIDIYYTFNNFKIDCDYEIGVIPKEINKHYSQMDYPSRLIKPEIGDSYFRIETSSLFVECDPKICSNDCDKESHYDFFKMMYIEDSETALKVINDLKNLAKNGAQQVMFMDIKCAVRDSKEQIAYINIYIPKSKLFSFNVYEIDNSQTMSNIVNILFSTRGFKIFCYDWKSMEQKFTEMFGDVFDIRRSEKFPISTIICLINRLNTLVESSGGECSIPKYFPMTWKNAYRYKSIDYSISNEEEISDDEESITKQQRKCIRKMSKNMAFRNLCYLTTSYDFDESESTHYSYWQRKPLRLEQKKEMTTRLLALYDIVYHLNNAMYKDSEYKNISLPITDVRTGFLK
ncbi:Hypothetical protein SRAE_2000170300 [Strongyloides ratti]|uniref:Ribonuclease H-like domain-containing protein n=1 Tax=Strongyloides ratti TaxID=34506 RepID=A0A090LFW3_STRRB|nr:Hypothetical protein SRAE_2000170300 [Strongyloides ratti]CEF67038.1 Hypothetical protein SRAE_2000170300 [Strongyloides ratti]